MPLEMRSPGIPEVSVGDLSINADLATIVDVANAGYGAVMDELADPLSPRRRIVEQGRSS